MNPVCWETLTFEEAFNDITSRGHKIDQSQFKRIGKYPIVDQGQNPIAGYVDDRSLVWNGKLPVIAFGDHTRMIKYIDFPFVLGADGLKILEPVEDILPRFAYFLLLHLNIPSAGYSRHFKFLKEISVGFPSLPEQKRLSAILDRADRLRRQRRYAAKLSESFVQAVFIQMFGDPTKNPKDWQRVLIRELGEVETGNTPDRNQARYYGNHIEWIKSDNIVSGELFVTRSREMLSEEGLKEGRCVGPGSLLTTCIAGSPTSIGNSALTDRKVAFNQQINAITPYKDVDPLFLYGLMLVAKPLVQRSTTLGMKRIITKSKFENLQLVKPPQTIQRQFAGAIAGFERLRAQQREAERQAEHLFQTLLHRAFRGEL